jgi:hypothetical protein
MTISEAITQLQAVKENQYDDATLVRWISDLEGVLYEDIVKNYDGGEDVPHGPYTAENMETELMVPEPYADIYIKYLAAQVDYYNAESARYTNSMIMYNMALDAYGNWYNRNHLPKQRAFVRF